jgi:tetratricopeptide (TPR) repeat protein
MQPPLPAPTAQGSFAKTPLPHLVVYALERGLSGTFELTFNGASAATMLVVQGFPAKLRTTDGVFYLGDVMVELGMISPEHLAASLQRLQESPRLQGQLLKEMGVVDDERIEAAVRAQLKRKLEHLFTLPAETTYAYYDAIDLLQRYGGPPTPIDPLPVLWRGVKQAPSWEHVDATLRRVGGMAVRLTPAAHAQIGRLELTRPEMQAIDMIAQRPARVVDIANSKLVGPSIAQQLVYFLVITKQVDLLEAGSMRPPAAGPNPNQTARLQAAGAQSQTGQTVARVQLQARPVARAPLVVEETMAASPANDERASIPGTDAPKPGAAPSPLGATFGSPPPPPAAPVDGVEGIASLITSTISASLAPGMSGSLASSLPPPPVPGPAPLPAMPAPPRAPSVSGMAAVVPPAPPSSSRAASNAPPAAPSQPRQLTAEQNALKTKILERAEQITSQNYFQMLGVEKDAPPDVCQKAFFALAKVWHPDRLPPALGDVKDACSKVFTHITEANATLSDPKRRQDYMTLMKDGGATPDDQAKIQTILEAATEFQKAEILMKRNPTDAQVFDLVKRACGLDPEQVDYMALYTWLEAQLPMWQSKEKTQEKIAVLDKCIQKNPNCERAYFYRAMLYKRIDEGRRAIQDFKRVAEMNPRNLDATREVRLYNMRGGSKAPPPPGTTAPGASRKPPPQPETLGGLFGKLFKK